MGSASRRRTIAAAGIAALVAVNIALVTPLLKSESPNDSAASTQDQDQSLPVAEQDEEEPTQQAVRPIVLRSTTRTAHGLDPVRITGSYPDVPDGTKLSVQWRHGGSAWVTLPLPAAVQPTGQFSTYVQLGAQGRNRIRVVDETAGTMSNAITLRIV